MNLYIFYVNMELSKMLAHIKMAGGSDAPPVQPIGLRAT
jgi:hypothetical protein